ncbi:MAG: hypothetical protein K9G59_11565 [Caulobacter sp.]|nr:hypothetical protein [Caulobacter sp.]
MAYLSAAAGALGWVPLADERVAIMLGRAGLTTVAGIAIVAPFLWLTTVRLLFRRFQRKAMWALPGAAGAMTAPILLGVLIMTALTVR